MAAISTTPPPLQGPTATEKKYDRQLRLWAAAGQQALEEAHVLLLNDGPGTAGIEALKNLVLPGVGSFTIVDDNEVELQDLGLNFFLSEESLGKSRAEETCRYLRELNPEVQGYSMKQSPANFIQSTNALQQYTLILTVGPTRSSRSAPVSSLRSSQTSFSANDTLRCLADYAWAHSTPLFVIHSIGFYSQFSLQLPELFPIVDTHPDPASTQDLRLLNPWTELTNFAKVKTTNLDNLSDHEHGHIPYLLLLLHYLEEWRSTHNGEPPQGYREKTAFKETVRKGMRTENAEGGEENFEEAIGAIIKSLNPTSLPMGLFEIFAQVSCTNPKSSANFWIITHAIREFYHNRKVLPLPGALPDMKSQSSDYITLQNIYKTKARKDLAEVLCFVRSLEEQHGRHSPIDEKEVEAFCKGAAFIKLIRGRRLQLAIDPGRMLFSDRRSYLIEQVKDETSLLPINLSILARDFCVEQEAKPSGDELPPEAVEREAWVVSNMEQYIQSFLEHLEDPKHEYDFDTSMIARYQPIIQELVRANDSELHNISALTGGMVAQEAIKVITKQYVPVDNTCVFDGITSKAGVLRV